MELGEGALLVPVAPPQRTLTFGEWNCRSLRANEEAIRSVVVEKDIDVLALVELNCHADDRGLQDRDYHFHKRGSLTGLYHGVALWVRASLQRSLRLRKTTTYPDALWVRILKGASIGGELELCVNLSVGVYYLSPSLSDGAYSTAILELSTLVQQFRDEGDEVIVLGDFNAHFQCPSVEVERAPGEVSVCGPYACSETDTRGHMLIDFLQRRSMMSLHGWRQGVVERTFHNSSGPVTTVDYVLVTPRLVRDSVDYVVDYSVDMPSDHYLVLSRLSLLVRRDIAHAAPPLKVSRGRWSVPRLSSAVDRERATHSCEVLQQWHPSVDSNCEQATRDFMERCAGCFSSFARWRSADDQRTRPPRWLDCELRQMVTYRRSCYAKWRVLFVAGSDVQSVTIQWREYERVRAMVVATTWMKKRVAWTEFMKTLNSFRLMNPRSLYATIKKVFLEGQCGRIHQRSLPGPVRNPGGVLVQPGSLQYMNEWAGSFVHIGNDLSLGVPLATGEPVVLLLPERWSRSVVGPESLEAAFSFDEVQSAVRHLKLNTAGGPDTWTPELLRGGGAALCHGLTQLFNFIWTSEEIPHGAFSNSYTVLIPKVEDSTDPGDYRGISLLNVIAKVFTSVMTVRLTDFLESDNLLAREQQGFRRGRGTEDNLFVLTQGMFECMCKKVPYYVAFIDIRKAFDRVWRGALFLKLSALGVDGKFLRVLRALYEVHRSQIRIGDDLSDLFDIAIGTKQGDTLSPVLFDVFVNDLVADLNESGLGLMLPVSRRVLRVLLFADDIVITASSEDELQRMLDVVSMWGRKWRMEFGVQKCGILQPRDHCTGELLPMTRQFALQSEQIPIVAKYRYLGVLIRHDLNWKDEIEVRAVRVRKCVGALLHFFTQKNVLIDLKVRVFRSLVLSVALSGASIWCTGKTSMAPLLKKMNLALRCILGAPPNTVVESMWSELGIMPPHWLVVEARIRLLQKWSMADRDEWVQVILNRGDARGEHLGVGYCSWLALTVRCARKAGIVLVGRSQLQLPHQQQSVADCLRTAAVAELSVRAGSVRALAHYLQNVGDEAFVGQPYLVSKQQDRVSPLGAKYLFQLRAGSFTTLDRLNRWPGSGVHQASCPFCPTGQPETEAHLLHGCGAWGPARLAFFNHLNAVLSHPGFPGRAQRRQAFASFLRQSPQARIDDLIWWKGPLAGDVLSKLDLQILFCEFLRNLMVERVRVGDRLQVWGRRRIRQWL